MRLIFLTCAAAVALLPHSAFAQDDAPERGAVQGTSDAPEGDDDFHGDILVTAPGLRQLNLLAGTSVVSGTELQRNLDGQVGEILTKLPGVSATSFAPGVSRPVLRGFQGDRVRVLTDGIGSIDASNASADHAVSIDPLTAERIEVLRGPAVLLYGSSAIGGAVNVIDKRIPRAVPDEAVHIDAIGGVDTAYDLREIGGSADAPLGGNFAFHVDGAYRRTDDVEVPGYVIAAPLRADLLARADATADPEEADELREVANERGVLPSSATETWSAGAGLAWIGDGGSTLGGSVGWYDTVYGISERPGAEEEPGGEGGEEEGVAIDLHQFRADLRGGLTLGDGFLSEVRTRWGYSDYRHSEIEGGEVGTTFLVEGVEGRLELVQAARGGWSGSFGGQYMHRDFEAIGEEAFVPRNRTDQYGLFAVQEIERGPWQVQFGGRYERTDVGLVQGGQSRSFDAFSGAIGASREIFGGLRAGINVSRAERAPTAEELFADGPHVATQQFEVGDPNLAKESAWGLEGYLRGAVGPATLSLGVFQNWFDDFVYLEATGTEEDGLPVYQQMQQGAEYFGVEAELTMPLWRGDAVSVVGDLKGDYIRATLDDGSPVPRIPPLSLLGGLELQADKWDARAEVEWYDGQDRVAAFETPTDGFAFVNLSLAWKPLRGRDNVTLMLQGDNVFDATGRRHASFTKDFVPLAGRNVKLSLKVSL